MGLLLGSHLLLSGDRHSRSFVRARVGVCALTTDRQAYISCSVGQDRLFALFSGRLVSDQTPYEDRSSGRFVHVFDWEGDLGAVFQLDRNVNSITVNSTGDVLFASSLADARIYVDKRSSYKNHCLSSIRDLPDRKS